MYQPNQATTEIGRMRAEEMRARAERYRTIQKAKQHKKHESEEEEESLSHSRTFVYRKALGIVGLSLLMVLVFAGAALAMPAEADPPSSVDDKHQALVSKPQVREGPPSVWEARADVPTRSEIQHLVPAPIGGQDRAETQHLVPGAFGGQERAAIQHVGEADQPSTFNPAPGLTPSSGGIELELVLLLSGTVALASLGALVWFRRHSIHAA
jgi:hypothetical protein